MVFREQYEYEVKIALKLLQSTEFSNTNAKELEEAERNITKALEEKSEEIISEHLRQANRSLERIIGNIDVEEILSSIFSNFCIGK